jgi:holliday junction DNA helicase RuvA
VLAYLSGTLKSKQLGNGSADLIVLEVQGVGFEVHVARSTCVTIGQVGESVTIFTALSIKETDWTIFGFDSQEMRELFFLLQSVSGIGPKLALSLTGSYTPRQLAEAILNDDQKQITQVPGVGTKVAQRIILELKSKIEDWYQKRFQNTPALPSESRILDEVRTILDGLGYTNTEINMALAESRKEAIHEDVETLVRFSLKTLATPSRS